MDLPSTLQTTPKLPMQLGLPFDDLWSFVLFIACLSAAIGLGYFGEQAKEAIPALQAAQRDRDARVREAAGVALSRIDPARFPAPASKRGTRNDKR